MLSDQPASRRPAIIGFAAGAVFILLAGLFFFGPFRSAPRADGPVPVTSSPAVSTPAPEAMGTTTNPHSFPAARTATPGPPVLAGTLRLDPSITMEKGATLTVFLIARTGTDKPRTVLARRMDISSFPAPFSLSSADTMAGDEKLSTVSLEARVDMDNDAMTREPGSPTARLESVAIGDTNVDLTLRAQ